MEPFPKFQIPFPEIPWNLSRNSRFPFPRFHLTFPEIPDSLASSAARQAKDRTAFTTLPTSDYLFVLFHTTSSTCFRAFHFT
jgi:hypothetical protein